MKQQINERSFKDASLRNGGEPRKRRDGGKRGEDGGDIWRKEAQEANSRGFHKHKARLENAALQLMEPDAYRTIDDSIRKSKTSRQEWAEQYRDVLYHLLEERAIPCTGVLFRVKHKAGVLTKMQSKGLSLDEIHDLFACRIVVPTEADCYAALGVIHHSCKPRRSRIFFQMA